MSSIEYIPKSTGTTAARLLAMIRAYSADAEILTDYIVVTRTIQTNGELHQQELQPIDQDQDVTRAMLTQAYLQLTD